MNPLKILVVDDYPLAIDSLKRILERRGYDVRLAENGKIGFDLFTKNPCDVVITDYKMPMMNGLEMAEAIKKISPQTKIVMLTATEMNSSPFLNMIAYKPISAESIEKILAFIAQSSA